MRRVKAAVLSELSRDPEKPEGVETVSPETQAPVYDILRAIRKIIRRVSLHSRVLARQAGLTVPQILCLKAISEGDSESGVTLVDIAKKLQISSATATGIVDRLERAGLVERKRKAKDRRKITVSLTEVGHERLKRLPIPLQDRFVEKLFELDVQERENILLALDKVVEMMDATEIDASPILAPGEVRKATPHESPTAASGE